MLKQDNICKFITKTADDRISTSQFVLEKNMINREDISPKNTVYLVNTGEGTFTNEAGTKKLKQGDIFFVMTNQYYKIENVSGMTYMFISFSGDRSEELFQRFGITQNNCVFQGHESLFAFWQNALIKATEKNLDLISEAVLLYTFGEMTQAEETGEQRLVNSVIRIVEENYSDSALNLESVSKSLGYNSKYVSRAFKTAMGTTFSAYLTNIRIRNAGFLFEQGVTSIKNVAMLSGYNDPFYFSNVFKSNIGVSPSEYLKKRGVNL